MPPPPPPQHPKSPHLDPPTPTTPICPTWTPPPHRPSRSAPPPFAPPRPPPPSRPSWNPPSHPPPPPPPQGASGQQLAGAVIGVQNRGVAPPRASRSFFRGMCPPPTLRHPPHPTAAPVGCTLRSHTWRGPGHHRPPFSFSFRLLSPLRSQISSPVPVTVRHASATASQSSFPQACTPHKSPLHPRPRPQ